MIITSPDIIVSYLVRSAANFLKSSREPTYCKCRISIIDW
nr:MAG TPA: hypothetical protein [Caudoviricetes sp.]